MNPVFPYSALSKLLKSDRYWVVFSVHDDLHPFLELWNEPTEVASKPPHYIFPLAVCQHIRGRRRQNPFFTLCNFSQMIVVVSWAFTLRHLSICPVLLSQTQGRRVKGLSHQRFDRDLNQE
jgi:hypothetical protein